MKFFIFYAALLMGITSYSQDQQGYYINNNGQRIDGYFKTTDFYNDASLEFKSSSTGEFAKLSPESIREYGIGTEFKFQKFSVKVDKADSNIRKLSRNKEAQWEFVTIFLSVLVEGDATLYSYKTNEGTKFFYAAKGKNDIPEQLLYKKYKPTETAIAENNYFRQQLYNNVNCEGKNINDFLTVQYVQKTLINIFKAYNTCAGSQSVEYKTSTGKTGKTLFTLYAGIHNMKFGVTGADPVSGSDNFLNFSIGAEVAYRLPSDKWEIFLRGEYEKLSGDLIIEYDQPTNSVTSKYELDNSNFNFFVGSRYNFIINAKNIFFTDAALGIAAPTGQVVNKKYRRSQYGNYDGGTYNLALGTSFFMNFGVGYAFNNKYGIYLKYETNRNMFTGNISTEITRLGLNLRYTF